MARQATLTPQEAENLIGPRGNITVRSGATGNRALVRKWLTAHGVDAAHVMTLKLSELASVYNDTSDETLRALKLSHPARVGGIAPDFDELDDDTLIPSPAPVAPLSPVTPPAPSKKTDDVAAQIGAAIAGVLAAQKPSTDENRVREIIREELPRLVPTVRIEIKRGDDVKQTEPKLAHYKLPLLVKCLSAGVPVAMVGPAGAGKTTAFEQACEILGIRFFINGAVQGAHELLGYEDAHGKYHRTPFREAFENGGGMCLDELDAGDAAGMLVLNSALANCFMPFPDQTSPVKRHEKFLAGACLNTFGNGADRLYVGRNQLDAAMLDRFAFIAWDYDARLEQALASGETWGDPTPKMDTTPCNPRQWTERVQALRAGATKEKARVVISPRASIYGVRLLAAGVGRMDCEELLIWKGCDAELRRRIENSARRA